MASACTNGPGYVGRGDEVDAGDVEAGLLSAQPQRAAAHVDTRIPGVTPVRLNSSAWRRARARAARGEATATRSRPRAVP